MKMSLKPILTALALAAIATAIAEDPQPEIDPLTGLKIAPGWELVRNNCITCHSAKQFLQQRGTRVTWDHVITWMQKSGGLWPLDPDTRGTILDYLEANHGPGESYRRPPIPAHLMPANPYISEARRAFEAKHKLNAGTNHQ
jgi:mono/diheme cytochrome c family protein